PALGAERYGGGGAGEPVLVHEPARAARAVVLAEVSFVLDRGQQVRAVAVEVPLERHNVAGDEVPAVARPLDDEAGPGLLLHPDLGRPPVVLKDVVEVVRAVAARAVDAVEPLGVVARPVVPLELVDLADGELVLDRAGWNGRGDRRLGLEVLVR